jgi:hypothetical protein
LPKFLYLLLKLSSTPSLWISIQTFTIWRNLLLTPTADRLSPPPDALGALLALAIDHLVDYEDLLTVPEYAGYAAFLREDFDEGESSGGVFRNFLAGVKRVLMEIVEGVVGRECFAALEFMRGRLRRFMAVERFNESGRDERGCCKRASPAYIQACCVFRGVSASHVGTGLYLDRFTGTDEERVQLFWLSGLTGRIRPRRLLMGS